MKPALRREDAFVGPLPDGSAEHVRDFITDSVGCMRRLHQTFGPLVAFSKGSQRTVFAFGTESNRLLFQNPDVFQSLGFYTGPKNSAQRRLGNETMVETEGER